MKKIGNYKNPNYPKEYYIKNREKAKSYYIKNREKIIYNMKKK